MKPDPFVLDRATTATGPVLTLALASLRNGFNVAFPNRDKGSDGWIGDAAHQLTSSGHNPDDTPGVRAEYSDVDTIPEVRAIDVDKDLRSIGWTMQAVIDRILDTPRDTKRLRYIIYAETVWSKDAGWLPRHYSGLNPHTKHAHFSGEPAYDNDGSPWSVQLMGDDVYSETEMKRFPWQYIGGGLDAASSLAALNETWQQTRGLIDAFVRIEAKLDQLLAGAPPSTAQHTHETGLAIAADAPED